MNNQPLNLMKNKIIIMLVSTALISGSCKESSKEKDEIPIAKSTITVTDGKFTPEVMQNLGRVSDPQVSPDGTKILYGVSYTSIEQNKSNRELFVMNIDGSDNRQITSTLKSENNARWIDGGKKIAYLYEEQLYVMNSDGSSPKQISNVENGISEFAFSPKGDKILYISRVKSIEKPVDKYPDLDKATGRIIKDLMYRHWDEFVEAIPHPFITDFDGKSLSNTVDILEGEPYECPTLPFGDMTQLSWSPDGENIIYSCRKLAGKEYAFSTNTDIYLYNIESKKTENLTEGMMGYDTDPLYSPDGKSIAWISMRRNGYEADKKRLFVMDLDSRTKRELTIDYPKNFKIITWMPDGSDLLLTSFKKVLTGVNKVKLPES